MTKKIYTCKSSFSLSLFCNNSLKQTWEILTAVYYVSYVKSFISVAVRICWKQYCVNYKDFISLKYFRWIPWITNDLSKGCIKTKIYFDHIYN